MKTNKATEEFKKSYDVAKSLGKDDMASDELHKKIKNGSEVKNEKDAAKEFEKSIEKVITNLNQKLSAYDEAYNLHSKQIKGCYNRINQLEEKIKTVASTTVKVVGVIGTLLALIIALIQLLK